MIRLKSLLIESNNSLMMTDTKGNVIMIIHLNLQLLLNIVKERVTKSFLKEFGFELINKLQFNTKPYTGSEIRIDYGRAQSPITYQQYSNQIQNAADKFIKFINELEKKSGLLKDEKPSGSRASELAFKAQRFLRK